MNSCRFKRFQKLYGELIRLMTEEREAYESLPVNVMKSKRGDRIRETLELFDSTCDALDRIILLN